MIRLLGFSEMPLTVKLYLCTSRVDLMISALDSQAYESCIT
jgi:hypothetical protein